LAIDQHGTATVDNPYLVNAMEVPCGSSKPTYSRWMTASADQAVNASKNRIWHMCYLHGLRRKFFGLDTGGGIINEIYFNDTLHDSQYRR
jgi:hypothetical protein